MSSHAADRAVTVRKLTGRVVLVDKFTDPLPSPQETARHLLIPPATIYHWRSEDVNGEPLVHGVRPEKRGGPSVPFSAIVEAYVLCSLR